MDSNDKFGEYFYELQFYGILLSEIVNIVQELMDDSIGYVSSSLSKKQLKCDQESQDRVFKALDVKYKEAVPKNLPMIYDLVKIHLGVKKHILLPQDEIHMNPTTEEDEKELEQQLEKLRKKYFALTRMSSVCSAYLEQSDQTDFEFNVHKRLLSDCSAFKKKYK